MDDKMLSKYIIPGNKVDLQIVKRVKENNRKATEDSEQRKIYQTKIYDVMTENQIEVLMPMEQSKLILLPIDGEYDAYFYTDNGLYQCNTRVIDRYRDGNTYVLVLELTSNLRKFQRREYYRFSCALEMNSREMLEEEIEKLDSDIQDLEPGLPLKRSVIVDISGGGLRFVANHFYKEGSIILCRYKLVIDGESKEYNLAGKVLAVRELENRKGNYEHRVQYINMNRYEREEIIKYIFTEERKHRRKESR